MDAGFVIDWLNLVLRWAHMIVGIAWIGASFYFIWLDNHLHAPLDPADTAKGIGGEVWAVHGGGFYTAKKFKLAPERLPPELHWFKWEAYTTLITGFLLLCLVYYYGAQVALIDPAVMALSRPEAIAIGLAFLVGGWLVYDFLCRSALGEDDAILGGLLFLYCIVAAWALCHLFSGRGAYIHFGAMLGVIMVLNVFFVIIPGQRELVKAKEQGRVPEAKFGLMGRQRSVHNTYFTLPVLFAMLSNHYSFTYTHKYNWIVLLLIMLGGAAIRQFFVVRHRFKLGNAGNPLPYAMVGIVVLGLTIVWMKPEPVAAPAVAAAAAPAVPFSDVQKVLEQRCFMCHGPAVQMKNVRVDSPEQVAAHAQAIYQQVVVTKIMPMNNATGITDEERALISRWFQAGAKTTN